MQVRLYHVTVLSNFLLAYDKYTQTYDKANIPASTYPGVFFLLDELSLEIGVNKATQLLEQLNYSGNSLIAIETIIDENTLHTNEITGTGLGRYINSSSIVVSAVYFIKGNSMVSARIEDVVAQSYQVLKLTYPGYSELAPRSISILPIAKGCQAKCRFCFSKTSISNDQQQETVDLSIVHSVLNDARQAGAIRAVITGGGEPGLVPFDKLVSLISACGQHFDKVVLISNGYFISKAKNPAGLLSQLDKAGLSVLSVSRHHYKDKACESIMNLSVDMSLIISTYQAIKSDLSGLGLRLICVLQKGGIDSVEKVERYISWAAEQGVNQICFKELYVSSNTESMFYDHAANNWSYDNQVPLSLLVNHAIKSEWKQVSSLPWGSPVFEVIRGQKRIHIAAYTEPSVSWELTNKLCRSWNLMSDGRCYASLETADSQVLLDKQYSKELNVGK